MGLLQDNELIPLVPWRYNLLQNILNSHDKVIALKNINGESYI